MFKQSFKLFSLVISAALIFGAITTGAMAAQKVELKTEKNTVTSKKTSQQTKKASGFTLESGTYYSKSIYKMGYEDASYYLPALKMVYNKKDDEVNISFLNLSNPNNGLYCELNTDIRQRDLKLTLNDLKKGLSFSTAKDGMTSDDLNVSYVYVSTKNHDGGLYASSDNRLNFRCKNKVGGSNGGMMHSIQIKKTKGNIQITHTNNSEFISGDPIRFRTTTETLITEKEFLAAKKKFLNKVNFMTPNKQYKKGDLITTINKGTPFEEKLTY